jgi:alpha-L-fucosidase
MPNGEIEPRQVARLKEMGQWLKKYGQAIYGTRGGPYVPNKSLATTRAGNIIYLHILKWNGDKVVLPPLSKKVVASSLLGGGAVAVEQDAKQLTVTIAPQHRQEIDTIVKLELDGSALDIPLIPTRKN